MIFVVLLPNFYKVLMRLGLLHLLVQAWRSRRRHLSCQRNYRIEQQSPFKKKKELSSTVNLLLAAVTNSVFVCLMVQWYKMLLWWDLRQLEDSFRSPPVWKFYQWIVCVSVCVCVFLCLVFFFFFWLLHYSCLVICLCFCILDWMFSILPLDMLHP